MGNCERESRPRLERPRAVTSRGGGSQLSAGAATAWQTDPVVSDRGGVQKHRQSRDRRPRAISTGVVTADIDEVRAQLDASVAGLHVDPHASFTPEDAGGTPAEWTDTPDSHAPHTVLYLHGGGYVWGSPRTHRSLTAKLASATRSRVLALDYRLAPEYPFPAGLEDALRGYPLAGRSRDGATRRRLVRRQRGWRARDEPAHCTPTARLPMPTCAALFSPWADLTGESETYGTRAGVDPIIDPAAARKSAAVYLASADPRDPLASPALADLSGLPPVLVQVGDDEILLGDSQKLEARLSAGGGSVVLSVWKDMFHVFQMLHGSIPDAALAVSEAGAFIRRHWASQPG